MPQPRHRLGSQNGYLIRINLRKCVQNPLISRMLDQYNNNAKKSINGHFFNYAFALQLVLGSKADELAKKKTVS